MNSQSTITRLVAAGLLIGAVSSTAFCQISSVVGSGAASAAPIIKTSNDNPTKTESAATPAFPSMSISGVPAATPAVMMPSMNPSVTAAPLLTKTTPNPSAVAFPIPSTTSTGAPAGAAATDPNKKGNN